MRVCAGSGEVEGVGHFVLACEDFTEERRLGSLAGTKEWSEEFEVG